jgi:hypothetical protein
MPDAVASWALRFTYAGLLISQNFGRSQLPGPDDRRSWARLLYPTLGCVGNQRLATAGRPRRRASHGKRKGPAPEEQGPGLKRCSSGYSALASASTGMPGPVVAEIAALMM